MPAIVPEKNLLTFTALSTFRSCPRKYKHRYEDNLKSHEKQKSLFFGQVIHESLTLFYRTNGDLNPAYRFGRPCEYLKYCQSGFNQELCDILFENVLPHEELPILGLNLRAEERQRYEQVRYEKETHLQGESYHV